MSYSKEEKETDLKKIIFKESLLNSNSAEIDSMQQLKDIFIKNTKLIKDSIEKSAISNSPPVFFLCLF